MSEKITFNEVVEGKIKNLHPSALEMAKAINKCSNNPDFIIPHLKFLIETLEYQKKIESVVIQSLINNTNP